MIIGSHVSMSGKDMLLGSVKEALSYGSNTFMIYTGAPQNTRRKAISELHIPEARQLMEDAGMYPFIVHAPYIINLGNTIKPETFEIATEFLQRELQRTEAMGGGILVLHPGSHVGAGVETGIHQIIQGLNQILTADCPVMIALETMAGKGSEIGRSFEELKKIYEGVIYSDKLRVCFDTCHVHDAGYDLVHDYENVFTEFDRILGLDQIAVIHLNDSKNPLSAGKDRHENLGFGHIGFDTLSRIACDKRFAQIPKILETPYIKNPVDNKKSYPPYLYEIEMLRAGKFHKEALCLKL